jgi:hypothetical protein
MRRERAYLTPRDRSMGEVKSFMFLPLAAPALPLDEAGKYVAGAYIIFLALIIIYVVIMAAKVQRIEKELRELAGFVEHRANGDGQAAPEKERASADV